MEKLLFINSCPRVEGVSRTLKLCDVFLEKYKRNHNDTELIRRDLFAESIKCYSLDEIEERDKLITQKAFENPMFKYAHEFSESDKILIGAPYWDLSFPAILKAYIESVCVNGITFHYTASGVEGLCVAKKLMYITTSGGFAGEKGYGIQYIEAIGEFLGISDYLFFSADGLDIAELDTTEIMKKAVVDIAKVAKYF